VVDGKIRSKNLLVPGSAGAPQGVFVFVVAAAAAAIVLRRVGLVEAADWRSIHAVRCGRRGEQGRSVDRRGVQDVRNG